MRGGEAVLLEDWPIRSRVPWHASRRSVKSLDSQGSDAKAVASAGKLQRLLMSLKRGSIFAAGFLLRVCCSVLLLLP